MSKCKFLLAAVLASCAALSFAQAPDADGAKRAEWREHHPRRAEVNTRLHNQNRRIHHEVKEGDMTKAQAATLHAEDRSIRKQEQQMAAQHRGHITKAEQKTLNQEENAVSRQIGK